MPRQQAVVIQNNFNKGLITEVTGLNFPENASVETYDCTFSREGTVSRRLGFDYEINHTLSSTIDRTNVAVNTYKWNNAGGTGDVSILVVQVGGLLHFYRSSSATTSDPLSDNKLGSTITLSTYVPSGGSIDNTQECEFTDGNGYLFVFRKDLEPIYCSYSSGTITATQITVKIRDLLGITEVGVADTYRPLVLTDDHKYNLANQGWYKAWETTSSSSNTIGTGSKTFTVASSTLPIAPGERTLIIAGAGGAPGALTNTMTGVVTSYSGTTLIVNVTSVTGSGTGITAWTITPKPPLIYDWFRAVGNYPSNADVWWYFKNADDEFDPADMVDGVSLAGGPAPKGFYILDLFNQQRDTASGIAGLTDVTTTVRPRTGAWFAGRVWYTGIDTSSFTEQIYFSQIIEKPTQFGNCHQANDPTSEERALLLPSDGGYIQIQGAGPIFKLFPVQNGLLVFAAKGIWFITGSQGIGFTANDYTITKISSIQSLASTSYVNVQGYPMFWNEEGIYHVAPGQQGNIQVNSLTHESIATFYQSIPLTSKKYVRGDYDPLNFLIRWIYRSTEPSSVSERYEFNRVLTFDLTLGAFYPWTISTGTGPTHIVGINYVEGIGGSTTPPPTFKYLTCTNSSGHKFTFGEERDTNYVDWDTPGTSVDYSSYLITGYRIRGEGIRKFQSNWIQLYTDNSAESHFDVQTRYDYAITGSFGRWSSRQRVSLTDIGNYEYLHRRLRLRGHGLVLSLRISSVTGEPFNIIGWITLDSVNASL